MIFQNTLYKSKHLYISYVFIYIMNKIKQLLNKNLYKKYIDWCKNLNDIEDKKRYLWCLKNNKSTVDYFLNNEIIGIFKYMED